jgi:tyrosyl-tRNA synthetase
MLTPEQIAHNAECFAAQFGSIVDLSEGKAEIVRNGDWFADVKYLEFLREIGRHFSVNKMLTAECFKARLEKGLSFLEFNYMLLQSYDFLTLYKTKGVKLQIGGDDQWSNILAGADLIRRVYASDDSESNEINAESQRQRDVAFAMTFALLLTKDGKKMGKTEKGAVWLDPKRCSVYDFFQYFRNVDDGDVIHLLKMLTFVPLEEIEEMSALSGKELNSVKERLAYELTNMIHGQEEADKALTAAKSVFASGGMGGADENMPTVSVGETIAGVLDLLVAAGLCKSKREARTSVEQGAVAVDRNKVTDVNAVVDIGDGVVIQKGKKNFVKVIVNSGE